MNTTGVNFTNILWAAFLAHFLCQIITNKNWKYRIAAENTFVQKAAWKMFFDIETWKMATGYS